MDLVLCHTTADFDALGAAVGMTRLLPGARIVLTGGCHPAVRDFLALHRDEYPLIERRSVNPQRIRSITVVDAQRRDRLGKAAEWLDLPHLKAVTLYDHHLTSECDIPATETQIAAVGATTTLVVEQLQAAEVSLTVPEATVLALGIHVDTGSLTFGQATARDARALAWLMEQGASLGAIADYVEPGFSPQLQDLLAVALDTLHTETVQGTVLAWVLLSTEAYVPGLSSLASQLMELTESEVLLLGARYPVGDGSDEERLNLIGRSRLDDLDLSSLMASLGGGGHPRAATATLRGVDPQATLDSLVATLRQRIPCPPAARELMSSPVRTIRPETTIGEAQRILLRYGHSGLSVVNADDQLVGIISRRDLDIALHHGFSHAPVKGYMKSQVKTITPETLLPDIEELMVTYDIGRLPVVENGQLVGIVTRTDVLRQLHQQRPSEQASIEGLVRRRHWCDLSLEVLRDRLAPALWQVLMTAAEAAERRGWHLYLVGGAVRDLLLADSEDTLLISDIDLVVDGFHRSLTEAAGVELAREMQLQYPDGRLQVHGRFQTAALLWHRDPDLDSLWIDIATARTEFYPYPAANPEVEASSIRQDLYRRDFTINALAVRLTQPRAGELLDFFGGFLDLQAAQIRVLHANSFIEDPTRIYRAVRFAVRLGFRIEPETEGFIRYAIESGVYHRSQDENGLVPALGTRLKSELKYILQAPYWRLALKLLADLGALRCIHGDLELTAELWRQLCLVNRGLERFDAAQSLEHWQMLLEMMLAYLPEGDRVRVAEQFQLPADSIDRLGQLGARELAVREGLLTCDRPSEMAQQLQRYDVPTLILMGARGDRPLRRVVWRYLSRWREAKPPLDGNDLKALGYKPGRQFKQMLDGLLAAFLDGQVGDRAAAEAFLATHFSKTS